MTTFYFLGGLALLYIGGEGLVRSAAALGLRFGMSPLVAGLTIVALATSAPELAISLAAALRGEPGLAVGNVVGSNICNLTIVLGTCVLVAPPRLRDVLVRRDVLVMMLATFLVPGLLLDDLIGRAEGAMLTASIAAFVFFTVRNASRSGRAEAVHEVTVPILTEHLFANMLLTVVSVGCLVLGSEFFVRAAVSIATSLGVSSAIVGLTAAALSTSIPELSASIIAARHGHPEMAAGNLIGSNIFNLLLILGVTSLAAPLSTGGVTQVDLAIMIGTSILAVVLMTTKNRVERYEGGMLVVVYLAYMAWLAGSVS